MFGLYAYTSAYPPAFATCVETISPLKALMQPHISMTLFGVLVTRSPTLIPFSEKLAPVCALFVVLRV